MSSNTSKEQILNEKYEISGSVISTPESNFYQSSDEGSPKKKETSRKRLNSKTGHLNMNLTKKKRNETTKDRMIEWNKTYSKEFGIWIQCIKCNKFRKSLEYEEEHQVPKDWCCSMNKTGIKNCDDPEDFEEVEFSETNFVPGSIVWAKLEGFPWWPGMVEDDPDIEEYYWIDEYGKMYYNVTFLDDNVTHAWVNSLFIQSYLKPLPKSQKLNRYYKSAHLVEDAKEKAKAAIKMSIKERLETFSFAHLFKGKWAKAIDYDNLEESEDMTKMLIKEIEDIDLVKSSDSEDDSLEKAIQENVLCKKKCMLSKRKKKKIDVHPSKNKNVDTGLENLIPNEECFASNENLKKNTSIACNKMEMPGAKIVGRDTSSDDMCVTIEKNQQKILHSFKSGKKNCAKSNAENRNKKLHELETEVNNKELNKMKKFSGLNKGKKKENLEKGNSVVYQEQIKVASKKNLKMRKTLFTPPVRNEIEYPKNEVNSKATSNQISTNKKSVTANKNLSSDLNDNLKEMISELLNEEFSSDDELKFKKSSEDTNSDGEMNEQATDEKNQNISDEKPLGTNTLKAEVISEEKLLGNVTQDKDNKIINSRTLTVIGNIAESDENHKSKPANKRNEISKVLEKNINSKTKNLDTKDTIEKKKYSKKKNNKMSVVNKKIDQKKENKNIKHKLEKSRFKGVLKTSRTNPYAPIKPEKQKSELITGIQNIKTFPKPAIMETEDKISKQQNSAQNDNKVKKYTDDGNKSTSLLDKKTTDNYTKLHFEQSKKFSGLNYEGEINSYSLCFDDEEPLEDEDSDPFEAD